MTDDNIEDTSHPYFVHGGCKLLFILLEFYCSIIIVPFVFLPSTLTTGFTFANNQTHVSTTDNQTATESKTKKENEEIEDEEEEEEEEEAGMYIYIYIDEIFFVIEWLFDIRIITIFVFILKRPK